MKGTAVASGPQEYFVVYDLIPIETKIVYPIGNESIGARRNRNNSMGIYGNPSNTFLVEYSIDNGGNWTTINAAVPANLRRLDWIVPAIQTSQAL